MAEVGFGLSGAREQALARVADAAIEREARTRQEALERDREAAAWRRSANRLDAFVDAQNERERRLALDDRRNEAQRDHAERMEIQTRMDSVYADFGERCRPPASDEDPHRYRIALLRDLRDRLGADDARVVGGSTRISQLADMKLPTALAGKTLDIVEAQVLEAARLQAAKPAYSTLPPQGLQRRDTVDQVTGERKTEWHGRRSYIHDMKPAVRRVAGFVDLTRRLRMIPVAGGTYRSERLD